MKYGEAQQQTQTMPIIAGEGTNIPLTQGEATNIPSPSGISVGLKPVVVLFSVKVYIFSENRKTQ